MHHSLEFGIEFKESQVIIFGSAFGRNEHVNIQVMDGTSTVRIPKLVGIQKFSQRPRPKVGACEGFNFLPP
jgi:hypothetical protein